MKKYNNTDLFLAAKHRPYMITTIVNSGININCIDKNGDTVLDCSIKEYILKNYNGTTLIENIIAVGGKVEKTGDLYKKRLELVDLINTQ